MRKLSRVGGAPTLTLLLLRYGSEVACAARTTDLFMSSGAKKLTVRPLAPGDDNTQTYPQ